MLDILIKSFYLAMPFMFMALVQDRRSIALTPSSEKPIGICVSRLTAYRSVPSQTDSTPYTTSIGHRVSQQGIAVSPDLMASDEVCYGDAVILPFGLPDEGMSIRIVNDVMAAKNKQSMDVWVSSYLAEKRIGVRTNQSIRVVKSLNRACGKTTGL